MTAAVLTVGTTRHASAASATAASATTSLPADPSHPTCAGSDPGSFPLRTHIHDGPTSYDAGGGYGTWSLDLTNTTSHTCENIHPVIVLVDDKRALQPDQPALEFYDGSDPHPVTFERTDADELVGVLDHEGFPGFTVRPGDTLTVKLRLAVISGAEPDNDIVANAAVVQRRGDDGDWVGESNDYRFRIIDSDDGGSRRGEEQPSGWEEGDGTTREEGEGATRKEGDGSGRKEADGTARKDGDGTTRTEGDDATAPKKGDTPKKGDAPKQDTSKHGDTTAREEGDEGAQGEVADEGDEGDEGDSTGTDARDERPTVADELARTGASASAYVMTYVTGALLLTVGALLVALARRKSRWSR
ncbi:cell wall protein [Streptomyces sp. KM273126]|uniref:cell wall protein n=1 Tax=Streptomyces sp. KM273126 TaxID=2545247 RepID=UPI002867FA6E|nr:cell wall protein [Streptomyces sp. KM273126]